MFYLVTYVTNEYVAFSSRGIYPTATIERPYRGR